MSAAVQASRFGSGQAVRRVEDPALVQGADEILREQSDPGAYAAREQLAKHASVDASRIGAVGYCFGGAVVINMARTGADLAGVVYLRNADDALALKAMVGDATDVVVVGGGDGTLGCAAGALVKAGAQAALGILPLGTRNHLAGELGIRVHEKPKA